MKSAVGQPSASASPQYLLGKNGLTLGTQADNPVGGSPVPGGSASSSATPGPTPDQSTLPAGIYEINGSLFHDAIYVDANTDWGPFGQTEPPPSAPQYISGPLVLNSSVLLIDGDADLSSIRADDATLLVRGTLTVRGGGLVAGESGMVIMAHNIVLDASVSFYGFMAAQDELIFTDVSDGTAPGTGAAPIMDGGIMAGGATAPLSLVPVTSGGSLDMIFDPFYTSAMNRYAPARVVMFREVR